MRDLEELARRFDEAIRVMPPTPRPTEGSLRRIHEHFGVALPPDLVWLARNTRSFGGWFASLGGDYDSSSHIIRINSHWRRRRPNRRLPKNLVVLNRGFDEDLDCLDLDDRDPETGEMSVQYWSPGLEISADKRFRTFREYLEFHVSAWSRRERSR